METKVIGRMKKLYSIHLEFTLKYITLTTFYFAKDTFTWQVMIAP